MTAIVSVRQLAYLLSTSVSRLYEIAANVRSHYKSRWDFDETKQKSRRIRKPDFELKRILKLMKTQVLASFDLTDVAHGGVKGRSPRTNAERHLGQACVVALDVKAFFDCVSHDTVYRLLRHQLGFGRDVASLMTKLTTLEGALPQGAPTSSAIANLVLNGSVDAPLAEAARQLGLAHTRFVDDIAFSGNNPRPLINPTARLLSTVSLQLHRKKARFYSKPKLRIMPRSMPQEITGLLVNGPRLSIRRCKRDAVRAAIYRTASISDTHEREKALQSIRGRINHVRQFNPETVRRLEQYLQTMIARQ